MMAQQTDNPIVLNNLAWLYHEAGDKRALELAKRAHELAPESPEILDTYGWILFVEGSREQGLALLKKAEERAPDNPDVGYHTASALHNSGETALARDKLDTILEKHEQFFLREKAESLRARISKN
jgi:tetratricopeptide (TPR) repeat protein